MASFCKHSSETFGLHKESRLLFDKLIDYQLFKKTSYTVV